MAYGAIQSSITSPVQGSGRVMSFSTAVQAPKTIVDSRFGMRKMPTGLAKPSVFSYSNPGRGVSGEHQT
jgi:hypothetical protein